MGGSFRFGFLLSCEYGMVSLKRMHSGACPAPFPT